MDNVKYDAENNAVYCCPTCGTALGAKGDYPEFKSLESALAASQEREKNLREALAKIQRYVNTDEWNEWMQKDDKGDYALWADIEKILKNNS